MTNYLLIGIGYIAERHMQAIKATGGNLLAALNKHDSVGILDKYFPDCELFTEFEIFDRHVTMLQRTGTTIHYVVVCSPNYLHDAHCRFGLRIGADVICEKPLCLNPDNAVALQEVEKETGRRVWNILQLRLHPVSIDLKRRLDKEPHKVSLRYITARGNWYSHSWKGDAAKSGGICMNIGIHFFDMLLWIFGNEIYIRLNNVGNSVANGIVKMGGTEVEWFLSTDKDELPDKNKNSYRCIKIDGYGEDFTDGFTDLHTESYREILAGRGFGIEDCLPALRLVHEINNS